MSTFRSWALGSAGVECDQDAGWVEFLAQQGVVVVQGRDRGGR
jgi:hypothetical protein